MTAVSAPWLLSSVEVADRPCDDESERTLAVRARSGDHAALRLVYERYAPRIHRFLRDMLRDPHAAADALQDTFARVFQKIDSLDDPERLVAWVYAIARNVSQEYRRSTMRVERRRVRTDELPQASDEMTPEAVFIGEESAASLERALSAMSADRRAVLLLRADHQLSYEEIAVAMGFSVAKVKIELHRARHTLRAVLFQDDIGGGDAV